MTLHNWTNSWKHVNFLSLKKRPVIPGCIHSNTLLWKISIKERQVTKKKTDWHTTLRTKFNFHVLPYTRPLWKIGSYIQEKKDMWMWFQPYSTKIPTENTHLSFILESFFRPGQSRYLQFFATIPSYKMVPYFVGNFFSLPRRG